MISNEKNCVIFDLDGTLALIEHRKHFIEYKYVMSTEPQPLVEHKADWKAFYEACVDDLPNKPVIKILKMFYGNDFKICIITGREDSVKRRTHYWLDKHHIPHHLLCMRKEGDHRPDVEVKRDIIKQYIPTDRVFCVFEDRDKVVKFWREEMGFTCFQVAEGDF